MLFVWSAGGPDVPGPSEVYAARGTDLGSAGGLLPPGFGGQACSSNVLSIDGSLDGSVIHLKPVEYGKAPVYATLAELQEGKAWLYDGEFLLPYPPFNHYIDISSGYSDTYKGIPYYIPPIGGSTKVMIWAGLSGGGFGEPVHAEFTLTIGPRIVSVDIKPGSYPNSINLKSKGVVPVAVLTTSEFDASSVDPSTVTFAGASQVKWSLEDVNGDGKLDLVLHFNTQALDLTSASTEATLTGSTYNGIPILGTDTVNIVPK